MDHLIKAQSMNKHHINEKKDQNVHSTGKIYSKLGSLEYLSTVKIETARIGLSKHYIVFISILLLKHVTCRINLQNRASNS